jgi:hypothetical protein
VCTDTLRIRQFVAFGTLILILGCATETGCIRPHPINRPSSVAAASRARQAPVKPSPEDIAKGLDEKAQRLFERLNRERAISSGQGSRLAAGPPSAVEEIRLTGTTSGIIAATETSGPGADTDARAGNHAAKLLSGGAPLRGSSSSGGNARASLLAAVANGATAGVILLIRRRRAA